MQATKLGGLTLSRRAYFDPKKKCFQMQSCARLLIDQRQTTTQASLSPQRIGATLPSGRLAPKLHATAILSAYHWYGWTHKLLRTTKTASVSCQWDTALR